MVYNLPPDYSVNSPSFKVVAFFTCGGSNVKEIRIFRFDRRQAKPSVRKVKPAPS